MDAAVLEDILWHIHNWFIRDEFSVSGCTIANKSLPDSIDIPDGVWYRIQGSYLNDGMHLKGAKDEGLTDETFDGTITTHVMPQALLRTAEEVSSWVAKYGEAYDSPYQSESFGGYSYSKKQGASGGGSAAPPQSGWQSVFAGRFTKWRKLS